MKSSMSTRERKWRLSKEGQRETQAVNKNKKLRENQSSKKRARQRLKVRLRERVKVK